MSILTDFVKFVQAELFKRPFINTDPEKETVLVRRGGAPRQMQAVTMREGEVLSMVDGELKGIPITEVNQDSNFTRSEVHIWNTPSNVWIVNHNKSSTRVLCQVVDPVSGVIIPNSIVFPSDSRIIVSFTAPQSGELLLTWVDSEPVIHD